MHLPDYRGGSIVNLMRSIERALDAKPCEAAAYPELTAAPAQVLAGAFEHYVQTRLAHCTELFRSTDLIAKGWFGLGPANPRLAERIGEFTLVMKDDYTVKDWILGEQRDLTLGVHGGVSAAEMYVPLILAEA